MGKVSVKVIKATHTFLLLKVRERERPRRVEERERLQMNSP
jgi:hypothetical protein